MRIPLSLRHRRFALFWIGLLFAWTGNRVLIWALPWQIRSFTDNPIALGSIGLIRLAPTLFVSLFAGVIADRFSRRKVMMVTQSVMATVALTLGLLTLTGMIQLWHIYLLLAVHATAFVVDLPARYSLTPNLVPNELLSNALSVETVALQVGGIVGPVLNGALIDQVGEHASYLVACGAYLMMVLFLLLMKPIQQEKLTPSRKRIDWDAIGEGIRFTFHQPLILATMLLDFLATLLTRADSLLPYFARDILGVEGFAYGFLTAAPMIGAVLAGAILSQIKILRQQGKFLLGSVAMIGITAVVFGSSRNYLLSLAALMVSGASDSISTVIRSAIRQLHTPDSLRGRMTSVNQIFFSGGPYLGDVKSGFLGKVIGVPLAVALGGVACIASVRWVAQRWPALARYRGDEVLESV